MNRMALLGGDRSRPLHFAGRRTELAALHARLEYVVNEQDPEDGLVLIDGIQGIGKTGLLREFARQAVSGEGRCGETEVGASAAAQADAHEHQWGPVEKSAKATTSAASAERTLAALPQEVRERRLP